MTLELLHGDAPGHRGSDPHASPKDAKPSRALPTLLIVDDEPSICKALSLLFSERYNVITVQSGEAALATVRNDHVDVMLVDLLIPDLRGDVIVEVAASVQPDLRSRTLLTTGAVDDRNLKLINACKCHFVKKPFKLDILEAAIFALTPTLQQDAAG